MLICTWSNRIYMSLRWKWKFNAFTLLCTYVNILLHQNRYLPSINYIVLSVGLSKGASRIDQASTASVAEYFPLYYQPHSLTASFWKETLKQLKNDKDVIVILSTNKGCVIVMDKKDYSDKMDSLVNGKQTCKPYFSNLLNLVNAWQTTVINEVCSLIIIIWEMLKLLTLAHCRLLLVYVQFMWKLLFLIIPS